MVGFGKSACCLLVFFSTGYKMIDKDPVDYHYDALSQICSHHIVLLLSKLQSCPHSF